MEWNGVNQILQAQILRYQNLIVSAMRLSVVYYNRMSSLKCIFLVHFAQP